MWCAATLRPGLLGCSRARGAWPAASAAGAAAANEDSAITVAATATSARPRRRGIVIEGNIVVCLSPLARQKAGSRECDATPGAKCLPAACLILVVICFSYQNGRWLYESQPN